jgi:hypothetical protein
MASRAVVTIQRDPKAPAWQPAQLFVRLYDGLRFPREISAEAEGGVAETTFGPREITSPITENVKFMDVTRLRQLAADPSQSSKIIDVTNVDDQRLQQRKFYVLIADKIAGQPDAAFDFPPDPDTGDQFRIGGQGAICHGEHDELVINAPPINGNERTVWLIQSHGSHREYRRFTRRPVRPNDHQRRSGGHRHHHHRRRIGTLEFFPLISHNHASGIAGNARP